VLGRQVRQGFQTGCEKPVWKVVFTEFGSVTVAAPHAGVAGGVGIDGHDALGSVATPEDVSPVGRGRARQATRGGPHHARQFISDSTMPVGTGK
jgi:hypothetical protein